MKILFFSVCFAFGFGVFAQTNISYKEQYRLRFHFTPAVNWCNDPNRLVYHNGTYHLFYQHNPFSNVWEHMHGRMQ